jgi:hypothetical protein
MAVAEEDVQASHWEHAAEPPAVPILRRALGRFAEECGMDPLARDAVDLALCEVVAHGIWSAAYHQCADLIVIDAAADREWMSVWVTYGRSDADYAVLPLATLVTEHVETASDPASERTRVILEFPLVPHALLADAAKAGAPPDERR